MGKYTSIITDSKLLVKGIFAHATADWLSAHFCLLCQTERIE
jgi:hypothetical protein